MKDLKDKNTEVGILVMEGLKWDEGRVMGRGKGWGLANPVCWNILERNLLPCMVMLLKDF